MSNCIIFALSMWFKHGGYIAIRRTRQSKGDKPGRWFHMIWIKELNDAEIMHMVPEVGTLDKPVIKKILFKGRIKTDDRQ